MTDSWAQRGDDIEVADHQEERRAEYAEKCRIACEGLPDGAIDGGWTAAGMIAYAKKLEKETERLRAQRDAWKEVAEHQYGLLRAEKYGDEDYPVLGALDAWAAGRHPILSPNF